MIFAPSVFSDQKEERMLEEFFADTVKGFYVDVGGNLPDNSISKKFANAGWDGVVVEPIPENVEKFKAAGRMNVWQGAVTSPELAKNGTAKFHLAGDDGVHSSLDDGAISPTSLSGMTIEVKLVTLDSILSVNEPASVNFLSIDTEGTEVDVLLGIDLDRFNVKLLLVEDWGRDFKIHRHMRSRGYKRVRRTGFNSWYVPEADNSIPVSLFGRLQFFRKYVLSMPGKNLRQWRHKRKYGK
jgi:FkbM family methyltransferase